jgi:hypothetical protein
MSEVKNVSDERGKRLQAVGSSYWLSPDGERFRNLDDAWEAEMKKCEASHREEARSESLLVVPIDPRGRLK